MQFIEIVVTGGAFFQLLTVWRFRVGRILNNELNGINAEHTITQPKFPDGAHIGLNSWIGYYNNNNNNNNNNYYYYYYYYYYLRSWALLEKPAIVQLLKNFPAFYGTPRFITVFTKAHHWSLSWARSIQSIPTHPYLSKIYFNIVHTPTCWSS
jgi:hypothetical protein